MLKRTLAALAVIVGMTGGACSPGNDASDDVETQEERPMKLTVELRGDLEVTVKPRVITTKVLVVQSSDPALAQYQVLGIESVDPITEGPVKVKPGFAIVPFHGDGKYTIAEGSPQDVANEQLDPQKTRDQSSVRVEWWAADREPEYYLRREKPCTVEVEDDGLKGRLRCLQMTQEGSGGRRFSIDFRWEEA